MIERGLDFKLNEIDMLNQENYTAEYARINPEMVVPAMKCNGEIICDSRNIMMEICKRHPGPMLRAD